MRPLLTGLALRWLYAVLLTAVAAVAFGPLADHPFDLDDAVYLDMCRQADGDLAALFAPNKYQGRPLVNLVLWLAYQLRGPDPAALHLLVVFFHLLSSLLLARCVRANGGALPTAFAAGLLFLVNTAHLRAVFWISAVAYPLALCGCLAGLLCYLQYAASDRGRWLVGLYLALVLAVLAHAAAAAAGFFVLYLAWKAGRRHLSQPALLLLPLVLAGLVAGLYLSYPQTLPAQKAVRLPALAEAASHLLWMWGRLFTTAHWLPFRAYEFHLWEPYIGAALAALWGLWLWRRRSPLASDWAFWSLLLLLPFTTMSAAFLRDPLQGPSRFVYLASAGSAVLLAWALWQIARRLGRPRTVLSVLLAALTLSSVYTIRRTEAFAFYSAGRNYINEWQVELGLHWLQRSLEGDDDVLPLEDAHYRLVYILIRQALDYRPALARARALFPDNSALALMEAVMDDGGPDPARATQATETLAKAPPGASAHLAVFYDLKGIHHHLKDERQRAVAAYRRSLKFNPRQPEVARRLKLAEAPPSPLRPPPLSP